MKITTVGVDLAKSVFSVHGVDEHGRPALRKTVRRGKLLELFAQLPACVVGMEACSGAQHWARELRKLGHEPRIVAAEFVEPYRRGGKNDKNDAAAICEAVSRPQMRFVPIKSVEQQAVLAVHRLRQGLVEERTALANRIRGLLTEYGLVIGVGLDRLRKALPSILEDADNAVPGIAREVFADATRQLIELDARIGDYDRRIAALARASEPAQRLMKMEGGGAGHCDRHRGQCRRRERVQQRAPICGLVGTHATPAFQRRQTAPRCDDQAWRCLPANVAHPRRACGVARDPHAPRR